MVEGEAIYGGDISAGNGISGGCSIYGGAFEVSSNSNIEALFITFRIAHEMGMSGRFPSRALTPLSHTLTLVLWAQYQLFYF